MPILPEIVPGNWYFVVTCPHCGKQDAISPAPSPSQSAYVKHHGFEAPCDCGKRTPHKGEQIQRLQAVRTAGPGSNGVFHQPSNK